MTVAAQPLAGAAEAAMVGSAGDDGRWRRRRPWWWQAAAACGGGRGGGKRLRRRAAAVGGDGGGAAGGGSGPAHLGGDTVVRCTPGRGCRGQQRHCRWQRFSLATTTQPQLVAPRPVAAADSGDRRRRRAAADSGVRWRRRTAAARPPCVSTTPA